MYVQIIKMHNYLIKLTYKYSGTSPKWTLPGRKKMSITNAGLLRNGQFYLYWPQWPIEM